MEFLIHLLMSVVEAWVYVTLYLHLDLQDLRARLPLTSGGRSGRVAWQFVCDWAGREPAQRVAAL